MYFLKIDYGSYKIVKFFEIYSLIFFFKNVFYVWEMIVMLCN